MMILVGEVILMMILADGLGDLDYDLSWWVILMMILVHG